SSTPLPHLANRAVVVVVVGGGVLRIRGWWSFPSLLPLHSRRQSSTPSIGVSVRPPSSGIAEKSMRNEKILEFLWSGSKFAEAEGLDFSLLSEVMGFHDMTIDMLPSPHANVDGKSSVYEAEMDDSQHPLHKQRQIYAPEHKLDFVGNSSDTKYFTAHPNGTLLFACSATQMEHLMPAVPEFDLPKRTIIGISSQIHAKLASFFFLPPTSLRNSANLIPIKAAIFFSIEPCSIGVCSTIPYFKARSSLPRLPMEQSGDGEPSARLHIVEQSMSASVKLADNYSSAFFEPQRETNDPPKNVDGDPDLTGLCRDGGDVGAPEKKLTLFALRLAILEKAASGLGTLGFIWATVVLLGGFAIALEKKDFWFITIILLIEGARIFSRSHELEWQHQATWSLTEAGRLSFRALKSSSRLLFRSLKLIFRPFSIHTTRIPSSVEMANDPTSKDAPRPLPRTWHTSDVPLLPFSGWVFLTRNVSRVLYWLQLLAASACVSLSLMRLVEQDFGQLRPDDPDKKNRKAALDIFYSLALAEALLFLAEKAYWEWKVSYRLLLEEVNRECHFGDAGMVSIKRFFYDAYSKCVEGSIFDGLKMDLVTFAEELLGSSSRDEQLIGARILLKFSTSHRFADATLRKIGTSTPVIERLIEMLNWKNPAEEEIRRSAAVIVSKLAGKKQNALRVAGISGAMESISSLLYTGQSNSNSRPDEASHLCAAAANHANYGFSVFNLLGLLILKKLAKDHDNCGKIGNTRGLLAKIIGFTGDGETLGRRESATESQVKAVKRSLQVVKMLARTTGQTGKLLRQEISEIVFTVSNIREILQYGENHTVLQKLGIEILTSLAMDEAARERIGVTGGMIKELLRIFLTQQQNAVKVEAGEALAMLALDSKTNCCRILREMNVVERLVEALHDPVLRINASRILRNLCKHVGHEYLFCLRGVTAAIGTVSPAQESFSDLHPIQFVLTAHCSNAGRERNYNSRDETAGRISRPCSTSPPIHGCRRIRHANGATRNQGAGIGRDTGASTAEVPLPICKGAENEEVRDRDRDVDDEL
ncbi:hypothetical protein BHE74_00027167, partial [Ensete ventricosum]